ncbi:probable helicase MAGATAMA 3 [Selaginella moellendorffii]|uniref:probable helicase MAGATAMA 3 n=1 Tax=Selaginella moellendorffii TaxID=88036 RepID=UPI000D1C4F61|nr:probable helicase MAGATAMA 3 [Selaginella moellendorffii]|eukprot:XP_024537137.1 probable helicase MAGATAMA 3 [Selaginella moellendorffii]
MDKASIVASHHTKLQKILLRWDYIQLLAQSKAPETKKRKNRVSAPVLPTVPQTFASLEDYIAVFEPLLLEECRAQIVRGDDDGGAAECHVAALTHCEKVNEFYSAKVAVRAEIGELFPDNELILITKEPLGGADLPKTYALAMVDGHEGLQILSLRLYLESDSSNDRDARLRLALQASGSGWFICKLCNLSTISREYVALCSLGSIAFSDTIVSASASDVSAGCRTIPRGLKDYLQTTHNQSQINAIQAGLSGQPLVLIQGPPGTGKTQTILGLLSVILHATVATFSQEGSLRLLQKSEMSSHEKLDHWLKASPWLGVGNPRDLIMPEDGDDGFFPCAPNQFRAEVVGTTRKHRAHVLVCAPSNSALDEIVLRLLKSGIRDENGDSYVPSIVRMGLNAHHSVQSVCMDHLVDQRLQSIDRSMSSARGGGGGRERERVRLAILEEAAIVCSTLSFSGSSVFSRMKRGFDVVVIDEAAQAVEPSTLVPLTHGCKQAFLVGDPIQLPATVLSTEAVKHGYGTSMFKRFQKAGYPVQMLNTQYRMHPQIRDFPSKEFYGEALEDGAEVEQQTSRAWHEYCCFGPFAFFDIEGRETQPPGSGSYINSDEAEFVLVLYRHLIALYPELKGGPHVAVISPYKYQVTTLRTRFAEVLGKDAARLIDINTVDGFQGREKDIAIFSCVRANKSKGIGFVSDFRRMNVGLTRARASMLVVGCAAALRQDEHWGNLIKHAQQRNRMFKVQKPYHALFNEASLAATKKMSDGPPLPVQEGDAMEVEMELPSHYDLGEAEQQDEPGDGGDGGDGGDFGDFGNDGED